MPCSWRRSKDANPTPLPSRTFQRDRNHPYNPHCYNCSELGHISKDCTAPCSIFKEPSHSNFICEFNTINHDCKPQGLMMAEQNFEAGKHALSSSVTSQPLNKKSNLEYIVNPDDPSFPFTLICKHQVCSQGPSLGCKLTPPPMKCTDCKDTPSPSAFLPHFPGVAVKDVNKPTNPDLPHKPPSSPSCPTCTCVTASGTPAILIDLLAWKMRMCLKTKIIICAYLI
ncbi:hypothetical protein DSO57_1003141 [Entomophthora muscae]|uniref:Uncharacterized protein n=1 Tax=Entomophthora muscae TaxID=34485 RepID=A0ACC2RNF3_9FUNG|nr:hypothetical protein DSO57_1003141 [Entomophthora muscae]